MVKVGDQEVYDSIIKGHSGAQIDYETLYIRLYITYNAWYCRVTGCTNNAEAIGKLKDRFVMWDDYLQGKILTGLGSLMNEGGLKSTDWKGLIDFWYRVRCELIHGEQIKDQKEVKMAYLSLNIFFSEIVARMNRSLSPRELAVLQQSKKTTKPPNEELYKKFIYSTNPWTVDMLRI